MTRSPFGWSLPPGVTDRMIDEAAGAFDDDVEEPQEEAPDEPDRCTHPEGHEWAYTGTEYGGDDESYHGEGRCYCVHCGADGDA